ncbi:hypothetical protein P7K49_033533, partial [Saguinus oedipus]
VPPCLNAVLSSDPSMPAPPAIPSQHLSSSDDSHALPASSLELPWARDFCLLRLMLCSAIWHGEGTQD